MQIARGGEGVALGTKHPKVGEAPGFGEASKVGR